tara:strand:- start:2414 stop:3592 length:1179 start_codon:yes stop_codon:yes gene_type:complete
MHNSLFINENLDKQSYSEEVLKGIRETTNLIEAINYSDLYKLLGKYEFEEYIKKTIKNNNVELLFFGIGAGMIIDIFFIKELSENYQVKIITGFPDSEHLFEDIDRYYAQTADIVWVGNPALGKIFNIYGLPTFCSQGFDTNIYKKQVLDKTIDVSFTGGINRGNRKEYINFLNSNGINVELAGFGTKRGVISTQEKNMIASQSKINLNFSGVLNYDRKIYQRVRQLKGRPLEISLLGSFVLSENASGLEDLLSIGNEIDVFHSKEELLTKIKFYLKNNEIRESMASKASKKAHSLYEISFVVSKLLDKLAQEEKTYKTYYLDLQFSRLFTSARFYYLTQSFMRGNFKSMIKEIHAIYLYRGIRAKNFYYDIPRAFYHFFRDLLVKNKVGFE